MQITSVGSYTAKWVCRHQRTSRHNPDGDTATNYTDSGGATNGPSHYYRIRLVP
jgi:hypothetical protein